jgi:hypothetical protein
MIMHLTVSVVDANGTVITDPNLALGYVVPSDKYYPRGMVAQIIAYPDPNYQVGRWTGTDNDASTALTNNVTMDSDKHVTVEFEVAPIYQLTTSVIGGHGTLTVQPPGGFYPNHTIVMLVAVPDPNYRVNAWTGTDNDSSYALINTVTMNSNRTVTVEFEPDVATNLLVPFEYATIEQAIAAANPSRDNIIVAPGIHYVSDPNGINFQGKRVNLMSIDPDDPNVISRTIIDCAGSRYYPRRAFHFNSGEDANTIVQGFTIRNGFMTGPIGLPGRSYTLTPIPYEPLPDTDPPVPRAERGDDAIGDGYGGAILCENASSPTIINCVITKNVVTGAYGGDGADGEWGPFSFLPPDPNITNIETTDDGQYGGHGGTGMGRGYGGAIACLSGSNPIINKCIIKDNIARGGGGGDGGDGGEGYDGGLESGGGNGGDAIGDGIGGGIYCDGNSTPIIKKCSFINNSATTGLPGNGGYIGEGAARDPVAGEGYHGYPIPFGGIAGGAAYYAENTDPNFTNCTFIDNKAYEGYMT